MAANTSAFWFITVVYILQSSLKVNGSQDDLHSARMGP